MSTEMNLLENIESVKTSLKNGDKYGILIYEEDSTLALYENVYEIAEFENVNGDLVIYYIDKGDIKELSCNKEMYRTFMLLPMLGELDGEAVYTGQKVFYKSHVLSLTYQDGSYVYFLDGETNDLFGMDTQKFDELYENGVLKITKEFVQNKDVVEKEKKNQISKLTSVLTKIKVEENKKEVNLDENNVELSSVTFVKSNKGEYLYICLNKLTGEYDVMTPAFVGVDVTGLEYKRYSVTYLELMNMFEQGKIEICNSEEVRDFVFEFVYGGDE